MGDEFIEDVVCQESEIQENEMKTFNLLSKEDYKVLLIKQKGKIHAISPKCSHYGAPLVKGHLGNDRIRCPWHGACFNINTGDIEDFPGPDSLHCFNVTISEGNVRVRAEKQLLLACKRIAPFVRTVQPKKSTFIVVGGGPAGAVCAETLRAQGYDGRLVFVMAENYLPYDRVKLSKVLDAKIEQLYLRSKNFYMERNIEIKKGTQLVQLNVSKKEAVLEKETLKYEKIFLATGSTPRRSDTPGSDLKNIFVLRTASDAHQIKQALCRSANVVIVGSSFIGMEAAAFCAGKVKSVVVIGKSVPFLNVFGSVIGDRILRLFQEKGVSFLLERTVESFEGKLNHVTAVKLSDGSKIPADICLLGIGVTPNTSYLASSGISLQINGTVEVNKFLQTSSADVFAGGDIAFAPVLDRKAAIAHWGVASYHGFIAAHNMLGQKKPLKTVPFFWCSLFGNSFRYAGYTDSYDDIVVDGSVENLEFIAFYCSGARVVAVTSLNRDPLPSKFAEMLYEGKKLNKVDISAWIKG